MPASDTEIKFYGLSHLTGQTAQACIGGIDCGDYTVDADGAITVPFGADDTGLMTAAYLATLDGFDGEQATDITYYLNGVLTTVTVSVVIGRGYTSRGQLLRPATQADLHSPTGPALGKMRRSHRAALLFQNTGIGSLSIGTDFAGTMYDVSFLDDNTQAAVPASEMFSGVLWTPLEDGYSFNSMLCWESTRPLPVTICAASVFLEGQEQ